MKTRQIIVAAVVVVVAGSAGAGGYLYGRHVGDSQASTTQQAGTVRQRSGQQTGQFNGPDGAPGGAPSAGGFSSSGAQVAQGTPGPGRGGTMGTIKEINGNTLTVTSGDSEVQVEIGSDTRITGSTEVGLEDLKAGQRISVTGPVTGTTVTAGSISVYSDAP